LARLADDARRVDEIRRHLDVLSASTRDAEPFDLHEIEQRASGL
jgi:hypothetical protein